MGSATSFYTFDPLGNAANVISATGTVLYNCGYDAYGQPYGNATTLTYGYGAQYGYYRDSEASTADNLLLCTYRWYDPATARWLTRDPIGYAGGSNLYGYVGGNPVGGVDPWGLDKLIFWGRVLQWVDDKGEEVASTPAFSGIPGTGKADQCKSHGPIPEGKWEIESSNIAWGNRFLFWAGDKY